MMVEYHMCNQAYRTCYNTCKRSVPRDFLEEGKLVDSVMNDQGHSDLKDPVANYLLVQEVMVPVNNDLH